MSLSQNSFSPKRQKHNSNSFKQKVDFCLYKGKVHGLLACRVTGSRCSFFPRNLPLASKLLFLSVAFILGCSLPSLVETEPPAAQAYPTCNLEVLSYLVLPRESCVCLYFLSESITGQEGGAAAAGQSWSYGDDFKCGPRGPPTETTSTERGAVSQKDQFHKKRDELMLNESKPRGLEPELLILKALKGATAKRES